MTKKIKYLTVGAAISLMVLFLLNSFIFSTDKKDTKSDEDYRRAAKNNYKIFAVDIPDKINFAGENVPLDIFYVREGLDRELLVNTYWQSSTILMLKRAWRYFPIIEPILKENNIPNDFKYLALIESGLMNVTSPSGAKGFWQFMKTAATSYGLEINDEVDERMHLEKATLAACKYLKDGYKIYNNWTLTAGSYNMGMTGISNQMKSQKVSNYYDLFLNQETSRYIFRIVALKLIYENPANYGFYLRKKDLYPPIPYKNIQVDSTITSLVDFAASYQINYRVLKEYNPWLLKDNLQNKAKRTYFISIPNVGYTDYDQLLKDSNSDNHLFNDTIKLNQI